MSRFVIIDGHAILYRAYHAIPPLNAKDGRPINAVYGFMSMMLRVMEVLQPTHLAVVFDRPGGTFRNKLFKDYQAQRPKADDEFISQIATVHEVLDAAGIAVFEMDGYEADDVIGTLVSRVAEMPNAKLPAAPAGRQISNEGIESIIVTGDRDLLQLASQHVKLYMPMKNLSEAKLYGVDEAKERMGVEPRLIPDFKALAGDPSDNIPGVSGIGPKTAAKLITTFGSVENLYEHLADVDKVAVREKLLKHKDDAVMSKKLATIICDAPIEFSLEQCGVPDLVQPDFIEYLHTLGFSSLIRRLTGKPTNKIVEKKEEKKESEQMGLF